MNHVIVVKGLLRSYEILYSVSAAALRIQEGTSLGPDCPSLPCLFPPIVSQICYLQVGTLGHRDQIGSDVGGSFNLVVPQCRFSYLFGCELFEFQLHTFSSWGVWYFALKMLSWMHRWFLYIDKVRGQRGCLVGEEQGLQCFPEQLQQHPMESPEPSR